MKGPSCAHAAWFGEFIRLWEPSHATCVYATSRGHMYHYRGQILTTKAGSSRRHCGISEATLLRAEGLYSMPRNGTSSTVNEMCRLSFGRLQRLSDEEIMMHMQNGCDDALAVLFDRYHRLVFAIAARVVRDAGEAEDVMQTVFLDMYRAKAQFDASKGSTKVWLLQYAYHRSINRRQELTRRNFYNQVCLQELCAERLPAAPGRDALPSQESGVLVREALATLSEAQKTALELAYFEGLTMHEIAEKTGETVGNVRHHFYRGLDKLRSCLRIEPKRVRVAQEEISRVES